MNKLKICLNCKFYKEKFGKGLGECHRYPPELLVSNNKTSSMFLPIEEENFCGEFYPSIND